MTLTFILTFLKTLLFFWFVLYGISLLEAIFPLFILFVFVKTYG